jgi:AcrR family transcriptional regulator
LTARQPGASISAVSYSAPPAPPPPKLALLLAAERLISRHGVDGVSSRQISAGAGLANNAALQYYFGRKDAVISAVIAYRLPELHQRRTALIAERSPDTLHAWLDCHVHAVFEQADEPGSHYFGFVAMLRQVDRDYMDALDTRLAADVQAFFDRLYQLLPHLREPLLGWRARLAISMVLNAAADRERALERGERTLPRTVEGDDLTNALESFLATASPVTSRRLRATKPALDAARLI